MKYDSKKNQLEFKIIKDQLKNKLTSFIRNEYFNYCGNIENKSIQSKIDNILNQVLSNLDNWMQDTIPDKYKEYVLTAINEEKWAELIEAFKQEIVFGTSGIRGKLIVSLDKKSSEVDLQSLNHYGFDSTILRGSNSINEITIMKNICGLLNFMNKKNMSKIVIGYDSRVSSKLFSRLIASIFIKNNFSVILFDESNTLPELSFAVTSFNADMGVEITASHNDKRYNGYKLIMNSGGPPSVYNREEITEEIFNNQANIPYELLSIDVQNKILNSGKLSLIKKPSLDKVCENEFDTFYDKYLDQIEHLIFDKNIVHNFSSELNIGYSALHGTGYYSTTLLFQKFGIDNVKYISKMIHPDPLFPLFDSKQILDPSDSDTANVIVNEFVNQYSFEIFEQLDILCYTDPDADRLGVLVNVPNSEKSIYGNWKLLKANDVWTLFLWYMLEFLLKNTDHRLSSLDNLFIVKNFVTTDALLYISNKYKIECIDGKVGFSDLTQIVRKKWKENKINIGMFEESCGFGMAGNLINPLTKLHILEKDGMLSLAFIIEILSYAKSKNLTLLDILNKIYSDNEVGFFVTHRKELPETGIFEGISGEFYLEEILKNVENFCAHATQKIKDNEPILICNLPISNIKKYSTGRYDEKFWKGFPDEGIRFLLDSETNHITIRSSGTEPKLRIFIQYKVNDINKNNILEKKLNAENLVKNLSDEIEKIINLK
jgi:phosphoglucomutase